MNSSVTKSTPIIAIAGNPNSGKTALFNAMTGSRQHVGNWPGVTVERKEGTVTRGEASALVVDLPGTYAFSSRALDEMIARNFIMHEHPDVVIGVVDSTNLERNLYLTVQMLEMGVPLIVALNMIDEAEALGIDIDAKKLSGFLGVEIVPTAAVHGRGVEDLVALAFETAGTHETVKWPEGTTGADGAVHAALPSCKVDYGPVLEREIALLEKTLAEVPGLCRKRSARWMAIKLLEEDADILQELENAAKELAGMAQGESIEVLKDHVRQASTRILDELGREPVDAIAERRYDLAASIASAVTVSRPDEAELTPTQRIDEIVLHPWLAYPVFFAVIWLIFQATFTISEPIALALGGLIGRFGTWLAGALEAAGAPDLIRGLLADGVVGGLGAVLEFAPPVFMLFLMISLLEDVGYMARAAVLSDRLMRAVGLHGKAFIPMILGFGCNVTGILATRSLDSKRDRLISILINPLISCAARLPVYVLFATAFFDSHRGLVVFSLYALGVVLAFIVAKVLNRFVEPGETATFVLELPPYRMPKLSGVLVQTWERGKEFLEKAATVILLAVVIVWALSNLPLGVDSGSPDSLVGRIGSALAPIFKPAGFGHWQAAAALLFGVVAKELIVGTLGVLYGTTGEAGLIAAIRASWTPLAAYSFLVMSLVYIPCAATIAAIRRETGSWAWTAFAVTYTLVLGWTLAVIVYQVGRLFGMA